jgi:uncharacterized protein (DUF924 family)
MYQQIIKFWFEETKKPQWFKKDEDFDRLINFRFSDIHNRAIKGELFSWRETSLGMLAEIIVLDQFSRNMYREKPESFAYDSLALILAQSAIAGGHDLQLSLEQRRFLYMPFMHSESLIIHQQAIELYTKLGIEDALNFERRHKIIIDKFSRYPHRNKILGRTSTAEEMDFLTLSGSRF